MLLICDDLWRNKKEFGYVPDLLLRDAPKIRLLISTCDRNFADGVVLSVKFTPLEAEGDKAREILLADVPSIGSQPLISDTAAEDGIRRILEICAGLPLALAIAGRGL